MRAPINPSHAPHARETAEHLADKLTFAILLRNFDFNYILFEHAGSDLVAVRRSGSETQIIANEVERSTRNLLRNLGRNSQRGAKGTIVACSDFQVMAAVARKLGRALPFALAGRVGLTNLTTLKLLQPQDKQESNEL